MKRQSQIAPKNKDAKTSNLPAASHSPTLADAMAKRIGMPHQTDRKTRPNAEIPILPEITVLSASGRIVAWRKIGKSVRPRRILSCKADSVTTSPATDNGLTSKAAAMAEAHS